MVKHTLLDFTRGLKTQKEIEIVQKHPDIFSEATIHTNVTKRSEMLERFKLAAKKVFKLKDKLISLTKALSTPVHHHLIHKDPEQWIHEHSENCHHDDPEPAKVDIGDIAMMSLNMKKSKPTSDENTSNPLTITTSKTIEYHDTFTVHDDGDSSSEIEDELAEMVAPKLDRHRSLVIMGDSNLEQIKEILSSDKLNLGMTLLKRLQKYKLISSTISHDGNLVVGIFPKIEGRIRQTG